MDKQDVKVYAGMVCFVLSILFGSLLLSYHMTKKSCIARAQIMDIPHQYGLFHGCMVQYNGKWLPISAIREAGF
jgi:hypothetical protein